MKVNYFKNKKLNIGFNMEFEKLLTILPDQIGYMIEDKDKLQEVIMDLGRPLILRYTNSKTKFDSYVIKIEDLISIETKLGSFGPDNRAGLDGTIHRFSRIVNRNQKTIGFTIRIGKAVDGAVDLVKDVIESGENVLIVGQPGCGKSTTLRSCANYISTESDLSVVIVDSSNEIAGDGDVPHPAVGDARRLQVPFRLDQHEVMIEAVENHMPDVIIVDEISSDLESKAAKTIAQRGVQLIATAHGDDLNSLMENPPLIPLIGNTKVAAVSDRAAEKIGSKFVTERVSKPVFTKLIEIKSFNEVWVYNNVADVLDLILKGGEYSPERRIKNDVTKEILVIPDSSKQPNIKTSMSQAFEEATDRSQDRRSNKNYNPRGPRKGGPSRRNNGRS